MEHNSDQREIAPEPAIVHIEDDVPSSAEDALPVFDRANELLPFLSEDQLEIDDGGIILPEGEPAVELPDQFGPTSTLDGSDVVTTADGAVLDDDDMASLTIIPEPDADLSGADPTGSRSDADTAP